jgi:hypothetical protein
MHRYRAALVLVGMTWAGCQDAIVIDPVAPPQTPAAAPATFSLWGSITMDGGQIALSAHTGSRVYLTGPEARRLRGAAGALVVVRATGDMGGRVLVASFTVLAMNGVSAIDGVLDAVDGGYALRLSDGTPRMLMDPPPQLIEHIGARMWVTGDVSKEIIAFGLLE